MLFVILLRCLNLQRVQQLLDGGHALPFADVIQQNNQRADRELRRHPSEARAASPARGRTQQIVLEPHRQNIEVRNRERGLRALLPRLALHRPGAHAAKHLPQVEARKRVRRRRRVAFSFSSVKPSVQVLHPLQRLINLLCSRVKFDFLIPSGQRPIIKRVLAPQFDQPEEALRHRHLHLHVDRRIAVEM